MMNYEDFKVRYPHCKSWADCKTRDEQQAFIFGWGSLSEIVNWIAENPSVESIEFALVNFFERGKREKEEAALEAFQRGWRAACTMSPAGQLGEPGGSSIALPNRERNN